MKTANGMEYDTPIHHKVLFDLVLAAHVGGPEAFLFATAHLVDHIVRVALITLIEKEGASL